MFVYQQLLRYSSLQLTPLIMYVERLTSPAPVMVRMRLGLRGAVDVKNGLIPRPKTLPPRMRKIWHASTLMLAFASMSPKTKTFESEALLEKVMSALIWTFETANPSKRPPPCSTRVLPTPTRLTASAKE
jgi:hypothetical protein